MKRNNTVSQSQDTIAIHATIEINPVTLQAIVRNAKKLAGTDEKGIYRVDTAEAVNRLISSFLVDHNFHNYIENLDNYK